MKKHLDLVILALRTLSPAVHAELDLEQREFTASFISDQFNPPTMAGRKTLLAPIHFIFSLLQKRETVSIWLYEQLAFRLEGRIKVSLASWKTGSRLTSRAGLR